MSELNPYTLSDFDFDLPAELIAQFPTRTRTQSRLLVVGDSGCQDRHFSDIVDEFHAGDVLVRNNTKVVPARLFGQKATGGKIEILVERVTAEKIALCMVKASNSPKIGDTLRIAKNVGVKVSDRQGMFFELSLMETDWLSLMHAHGHIPLPPYIERAADERDAARYQTVYAEAEGAVAAPTAGLHFDDALFQALTDKGVVVCDVTLHVGAGTFQPIKAENLAEHQMHFERYEVASDVVSAIQHCKASGGKVVAIGTTSVRALESASQSGELRAGSGDTDLFITPGYAFQTVDALLTNFHLPKSSLMMLVTAFAGYECVMKAYQHAIGKQYRFFSYGDAMFLTRV